jgi:hypothetical protein
MKPLPRQARTQIGGEIFLSAEKVRTSGDVEKNSIGCGAGD